MKKVTTNCCNPDETLPGNKHCLSDITGVVSKFIGVTFRNSLGNINYSTFTSGWTKLCNILQWGWKSKSFKLGSVFTGQNFTGELSAVDSAGTPRQGGYLQKICLFLLKHSQNIFKKVLDMLFPTFLRCFVYFIWYYVIWSTYLTLAKKQQDIILTNMAN